MTAWWRPALLQRYGVDMSKALGIVALLGVPCAIRFLYVEEKYVRYVVAGLTVQLIAAMVWTGSVGYAAQQSGSRDSTAISDAPTSEWWRPLFVQRHGLEIAKALGAAAFLGSCLIGGLDHPVAMALLYALLLGGCFWTITVGSEARRSSLRQAARQAAQWAPQRPAEGSTQPMSAQGFVGPQQTSQTEGNVVVLGMLSAVGCSFAVLMFITALIGLALAWFCLLMLYGLGHHTPPSWLTPSWLY